MIILISLSKTFYTLIGMLIDWGFLSNSCDKTLVVFVVLFDKSKIFAEIKSNLEFSQSHVGQYNPSGKQFDHYYRQQTKFVKERMENK